MSNWKHTLDFSGFYHDNKTIKEKARLVGIELVRLQKKFEHDLELQDIVDCFEDFPSDDGVEAFDSLMCELYDWADREKVWIKTTK